MERGKKKTVVLNVAEKPSVAKGIAEILSAGVSMKKFQSLSKYNPVYEFDFELRGQLVLMRVTSVLGHIKSYAFPESCKNWENTPFTRLYSEPLVKGVSENSKDVVKNLSNAAKGIDQLILWLDCDREGEAIAYDVIDVCREASKKIKVFRAHFSTVTPPDIHSACENITDPNPHLADAVNVRQEIDLRIGASFTRFQTLTMKKLFHNTYHVVSYGPCQFPTLGFIVERFLQIRDFVAEDFYYLECKHEREMIDIQTNQKVMKTIKFEWNREKLFEMLPTMVIYESCMESGKAKVVKVEKKNAVKKRPFPLNTLEFQKLAARKLHMSGDQAMKIAEGLYNRGLISYPRTETTRFSKNIDLKQLVKKQCSSSAWGEFARRLDNPSTISVFCIQQLMKR